MKIYVHVYSSLSKDQGIIIKFVGFLPEPHTEVYCLRQNFNWKWAIQNLSEHKQILNTKPFTI